jgi:hypothetical protein
LTFIIFAANAKICRDHLVTFLVDVSVRVFKVFVFSLYVLFIVTGNEQHVEVLDAGGQLGR